MKIKVNTKELETAIKKLDLVRPNVNKYVPILETIKVEVDYNSIKLIATDIEKELEISLIDFEAIETGTGILTNIANIKKSFKYLKDHYTEIEIDNSKFSLKNAAKEIKNTTQESDLFPNSIKFEAEAEYTYRTKNLYNRIAKLAPAVAKDDTRLIMTGIHFNSNEMVALDGYRLHINKDNLLNVKNPFTVPGKVLEVYNKLVSKNDSELKISVSKKNIRSFT